MFSGRVEIALIIVTDPDVLNGDDMSINFILIIYDVTARSVVIGRQAATGGVIGQWAVVIALRGLRSGQSVVAGSTAIRSVAIICWFLPSQQHCQARIYCIAYQLKTSVR